MRSCVSLLFVALVLPLSPAHARAQMDLVSSVGVGAVIAVGESENVVDDGYTVRGQVSKHFGLFSAQGQTGWTRLQAATNGTAESDLDLWHAGVGGRVHLGPVFAGVNAFYNFGDTVDEGFDLIPEAGVAFWRLELVTDVRLDDWVALRVDFVF